MFLELLKIGLTMPNGLRIAAEKLGNVFRPAMPEFGGFHSRIPPPIVFPQGQVKSLHDLFNSNGIGDCSGHGILPQKEILRMSEYWEKTLPFREVIC